MAELIVERLTGKRTEGFTNAAMQWGKPSWTSPFSDMPPANLSRRFEVNDDR